jgi:predicted nucleic acid-binding protein
VIAPLDAAQDTAARLALDHGLTFYDASYAAIARRIDRRLLSADSDLTEVGLASGL